MGKRKGKKNNLKTKVVEPQGLKEERVFRYLNDKTAPWIIFSVFVFAFLIFTPLGQFNSLIPPRSQTGYHTLIRLDPGDDTGYYSYLRSVFFDGDIDFFNEKGFWHFDHITDTGYSISFWAIGSAILWAPFFLIGHFIALLYQVFGYNVPADGYSFPYLVLTGIGSSLYAFLGLLLSYRLLRKFFSPIASSLSVIAVFFATPMPYYTFIRQRMSHSGEFFLIVCFIYLWLVWRKEQKNFLLALLFGIVSGMIFNIRFNTVTFLIILLGDLAYEFYKHIQKGRFSFYLKILSLPLICLSTGFFITVFPSFMAWITIFGKPLPPTLHPDLVNLPRSFLMAFFGKDWGLVLEEPVWIIGIVGLIIFNKKNKIMGILFFLGMLPSLLVLAAFGNESSFAHRFVLSCNIFLSFGVACSIDSFKNVPKVLWIFLCFILAFWQYLLIIQFDVVLPWNDKEFTIHAFKNIPTIFSDYPELLIRSSSFFKVIFLEKGILGSYESWFMVVFIPIIVCALSAFFTGVYLKGPKILLRFPSIKHIGLATLFLFFIGLDILALVIYKPKTYEEKFERFKLAGISNIDRGMFDLALQNLIKAKNIKEKDGQLHELLAEVYLNKGMLIEARKEVDQGRKIAPQSEVLHFVNGVILFRQKDLKGSLQEFYNVTALNPHNASALYNVGVLCLSLGEKEKARIYLQKSLFLNPDNPNSQEIKKLIESIK